MTVKEAAEAFKEDKRIDFKSRHGDFKGLKIHQLVYEKSDDGTKVYFMLKSMFGNSFMTAKLSECVVSGRA